MFNHLNHEMTVKFRIHLVLTVPWANSDRTALHVRSSCVTDQRRSRRQKGVHSAALSLSAVGEMKGVGLWDVTSALPPSDTLVIEHYIVIMRSR
jgi:hypothetical protein